MMRCTSPHGNAIEDLVEKQLLPKLLEIKPTPQQPRKEYAIAKANYTSSLQIKQDGARLQQMKQAYTEAERIRASGGTAVGGANPAENFPPAYPSGQGPQPGYGRPQDLPPSGEYRGERPVAGEYGTPPPPRQPYSEPGAVPIPQDDDPAPYQDPVLKEDVRNDWEFKLVLIVPLDPPPPAPAGETPTAAAGN
jgi:hypothetical protein